MDHHHKDSHKTDLVVVDYCSSPQQEGVIMYKHTSHPSNIKT